MSICVLPYVPGVLAHNRCSKIFAEWMKGWPNGWINKCMLAAPRHSFYRLHRGRCNPYILWSEGTLKRTPPTHQKAPSQKSNKTPTWRRHWGFSGEGKRDTKGEQAIFKGCFQLPGQFVCVFLYKVFPITVALSVSGSISSEFLCGSCQTYGINQGFGAGALAAGMLTGWQTRGSGVMESPRVFGLNPGEGEGGAGRGR